MDISSFLWGAGIGVVGALATGFLKKAGEDGYSWVKKKINPKASTPTSHIVIHVDSDGSSGAKLKLSNAEPPNSLLDRVSTISLDEINKSLEEAPPLQRDHIAGSYSGLRIEWDTKFVGGKLRDNGDIRLHLSVPGDTRPASVWCNVPSVEYRELGILPEGAKIRVAGEIDRIADYGIDITNARLHIYPRIQKA